MEEKTNDIANQTEIPVNDLPKTKGKLSLPKIDKKIFIGVVILVIVLVGISLAVFQAINTSKPNPITVNNEYTQAFNNANFQKAEQIAKQQLKTDKTNPQLNAGVIGAISAQGNQNGKEREALEQSKPYIDQALKSGTQDLEVLLSVGYAYEAAGDYEKALEYYKKATELYPNSSNAWFHYGHVLEFLNQAENANAAINKSLEIDPKNTLPLMSLGSQAYSKNNLNDAYQYYMDAASNTNSNSLKADALTAASSVKRAQYDLDAATKLAKQAVDLDPNFSPALGAYGFSLVLTNKVDDGIDYLNKAIKANPRISKNYNMLAQAQRLQGKYGDAINNQKTAIEKLPDDNTIIGENNKKAVKAAYTYDLAKTYWKSNLGVDVVPILQEAISLNPSLSPIIKNEYEKYQFFNQYGTDQRFLDIISA